MWCPSKRPDNTGGRPKALQDYRETSGKYSLTSLTPEVIAQFRDMRLAGEDRKDADGNATTEIQQYRSSRSGPSWSSADDCDQRVGRELAGQPGHKYQAPSTGAGRNRRLSPEEESRLLAAVDQHSNPMMGWIVRIALETGMRWSEISDPPQNHKWISNAGLFDC